jgi:hypothetical protein
VKLDVLTSEQGWGAMSRDRPDVEARDSDRTTWTRATAHDGRGRARRSRPGGGPVGNELGGPTIIVPA